MPRPLPPPQSNYTVGVEGEPMPFPVPAYNYQVLDGMVQFLAVGPSEQQIIILSVPMGKLKYIKYMGQVP